MVVRLVSSIADHAGGSRPSRTGGRDRGGRQTLDAGGRWPLDDVAAWLRELVWTLGPVAPGTAIRPLAPIRVRAIAGSPVTLEVRVRNRQRAPAAIVLSPTPLRSDDGVEWFPAVSRRSGVAVIAGQDRVIEIVLDVPADLPCGEYHGALMALAVDGVAAELVIEVAAAETGIEAETKT